MAAMLFCHIVDDYYLQGLLASLKQRIWWEKNAPQEKYKDDYKVALITHAFSWSFMITLPIFIYALILNNATIFYVLPIFYIVNTSLHAYIDDLKCNKYTLSLLEDQCIHFCQIVVTWMVIIL